MIVEKKSPVSGNWNSMELPITETDLNRYYAGELVQNVFPNLTADQREFIVSGITPEEWVMLFGEVE